MWVTDTRSEEYLWQVLRPMIKEIINKTKQKCQGFSIFFFFYKKENGRLDFKAETQWITLIKKNDVVALNIHSV